MKSYVYFVLVLLILLDPIISATSYSGSGGFDFNVWPPIGTYATYTCIGWSPTLTLITLAGGLNPSSDRGELREVYDDIKNYVLRVSGYPSKPPYLPEPLWISDLLEELEVSLGCFLKWEIKDFNGTHYWIDVELTLTLIRDPLKADSTDKVLDYLENTLYTARSLKHRIVIDFERKIYVNGSFKGVWSLFLFPWEIGEGSRVRLSAGNYWQLDPIGHVNLSRERALRVIELYKSSDEPIYNAIMYYIDKLGIPPERLIGGSGGVMIFNSSVSNEEVALEIEENRKLIGKLYDLRLADISLEEFLKANDLGDKRGLKYLVIATQNIYDLDTGIMVLHRDLQYQLDTLVRVIGIIGKPFEAAIFDPGPEFILLTSYKLGEGVAGYENVSSSTTVQDNSTSMGSERRVKTVSTANVKDSETTGNTREEPNKEHVYIHDITASITTYISSNKSEDGQVKRWDQSIKSESDITDKKVEDKLVNSDKEYRIDKVTTRTGSPKTHGVLTTIEKIAIIAGIFVMAVLAVQRVKGRGT